MQVLGIPSWYPASHQPERGRYLQEQFLALQERDVKVGILHAESRSLRELSLRELSQAYFQRSYRHENGLPTYRSHGWNLWMRTPFRFFWLLRESTALATQYIRRHGRPDIIHAHSAQWAAAAARRLSERWDVPYIVTEHYSAFARKGLRDHERYLARWGLEKAAAILCVSSFLRDTLLQESLAPPDILQVLPNPVDTDFFHPPEKRHSHSDTFRWITIGSLNRRKGVDILLRAIAEMPASAAVEFRVAGGGPKKQELVRLSRELGIDRKVRFLGVLSRSEVREELWHADAYVCPSRVETFGIPLIEAMATGLPVVSTDCGGPSDFVHPFNGKLVAIENPFRLSKIMRAFQKDAATYDEVVIRRYIKAHFSHAVICEQLLQIYGSALSAP